MQKKIMTTCTAKGLAVHAAIQANMLEQVESGLDMEKFEKFWEIFSERMRNRGIDLNRL